MKSEMNINWTEVLTILIPLGAFLAWIYSRLDKKFDKIDSGFEKLEDEMKNGFRDVKGSISQLENRVARIEGQLIGSPRWEPKIKTKSEEE